MTDSPKGEASPIAPHPLKKSPTQIAISFAKLAATHLD